MSYASSRPPEADFSRNSQNESLHNSEFKPDPNQKPIMRLMRQQKSFFVQQIQPEPTSTRQHSNATPSNEINPLKQFERSLEKERPPSEQIPNNHINNSFHNSTIKSSVITSPNTHVKEKFISSFMINESTIPNEEDDNIGFYHRVSETQKYGNENLDKIKKLIVDQKPVKSPKSPKRKKDNPIFSYNATSSTQKLHKAYLKTSEDRRSQYIKKFYADQMRQIKPFKIQNPMSQFLADRRAEKQGTAHKPLYERSIQLAKQIQQSRLQKQIEAQEQRRLKKQLQEKQFEQMQKQRLPNATTKQRQEQFYNEMMQRQKQKNQLKQQQKIEHLKQVTKRKPFVSKATNQLFNKIVQTKDVPKDFMQRNMEYQAEREKQKIRQMQKHDEEYCPFAPKISQASREKAKKYYERKELKKQSSHEKCNKDMVHDTVLDKDELQKKLKLIQEKIKEKKNTAQDNLNKHKRASSALPIGIKAPGREKSNERNFCKTRHQIDRLTERKTTDLREEEIPVYNRIDYGNRRTSSCMNLKK